MKKFNNPKILKVSAKVSDNAKKSKTQLAVVLLTLFLLPVLCSAEKVNSNIDLKVSCVNSTYANISYIKYKSDSTFILNSETSMTKNGNSYNYTITANNNNRTEDLEYYFHCDVNGVDNGSGDIITITSTGLNGTLFLIILAITLAFGFLIMSLFGNTEFFLFISGCLFLVSGIFIMIFGLNDISNWYTRSLAFISLGVGLLLTIGSYSDSEGFGLNIKSSEENYDYYEE